MICKYSWWVWDFYFWTDGHIPVELMRLQGQEAGFSLLGYQTGSQTTTHRFAEKQQDMAHISAASNVAAKHQNIGVWAAIQTGFAKRMEINPTRRRVSSPIFLHALKNPPCCPIIWQNSVVLLVGVCAYICVRVWRLHGRYTNIGNKNHIKTFSIGDTWYLSNSSTTY